MAVIPLYPVSNTLKRTGSPEAEGKAELIDAVVASITKWQGYTGGMSRVVSRVAGSLRKHRSAIHEARHLSLQRASARLSRTAILACTACLQRACALSENFMSIMRI